MKFAFSANAFTCYTLPEAIAAIAGLGYSGIEIMADHPHAWPPATGRRQLREIAAALRRYRLPVANLNAFTMHAIGDTWSPSWIDPDPRRRAARVEHTRQCLILAEALGAPHLSTEPGGPLPLCMPREEAISFFLAGLAAVEGEARSRGLRILIEPEPGLLIETGDQFAALFADLDPQVFGLNLDAGHFFCIGEEPAEIFQRFRPAVFHTHLEDIAATREHRHLIPGRGVLPLAPFLAALESGGFQGFATVELYPYVDRPVRAAAEAIFHLQQIADQQTANALGDSGGRP